MSPNLSHFNPNPLTELLHRAAFAPIENVGWIRVTGSDRVRWLNGMVTNSVQSLQPGEGCYNFFLNAQGRIQGDATAWMLEDSILLETAADRVAGLMTMLDHFIIMDDVELAKLEDRSGLLLAGPQASSIMQALGTRNHAAAPCSVPPSQHPASPPTDSLFLKHTLYAGAPVDLIRVGGAIVPRFELWSAASTIGAILDELGTTAASPATPTGVEQLRVLEGTPLYGTDIRDKDLPQETAQTRALHFSKGCYLGQEIVERIRSRGNVHRTFGGFVLTGELPEPGAALQDQEKNVGELTSVTRIESSAGPVQLALGYIRREALDRGATITYPGGVATPAALPFQLSELRA